MANEALFSKFIAIAIANVPFWIPDSIEIETALFLLILNNLDVSNFIKNSKSLYQLKGTEESFRILFNVLYNETPKILDSKTSFRYKPVW